MKNRKIISLISITILCFQSLLFPKNTGKFSTYATENTVSVNKELDYFNTHLNAKETPEPSFSFEERQTPYIVGESFPLVFHMNKEVTKVVLNLPEEAIIKDEELETGITVQEIEEQNKWIIHSETPQKTFIIPLVFEKEGTHEVSIGDSKIMIEIKTKEENQPNEKKIDSSDPSEQATTEETKDEERTVISSDITIKQSTKEENQPAEEKIHPSDQPEQGIVEEATNEESTATSSNATTETSITEIEEVSEVPQENKVLRNKLVSRSNFLSTEAGLERVANKIVEVSTWDELNNAIMNTFTGKEAYKNNSDYIKIVRDMENPHNLGRDTRRNAPVNRVDFVIDGQGHTVDFNAVRYTWASNINIERNIYIKNIKMYGQSAFGPFAIGSRAKLGSTLTYENVYYRGSQLTASWQADMVFKGNNEFYSVNSYVSPVSGVKKNTWPNESGLEAFRATFAENSTTIMEVENGNGLILASFLGDTGQTAGQEAYARLAKNAKVEIKTLGNTGEVVGTGRNIIGLKKGNLILEENSSLDISTLKNTRRGGINLTENTAVEIADHANLNININGAMMGTSAITLGTNAKLNVSDYGALNLVLNNQGISTEDVISVGANSEFNIGKEGQFTIKDQDGTGDRNLINVGANGVFQFSDSHLVDLDARANQNAHLINMTNPGTFNTSFQNISAWLKGAKVSETPNFNWRGLFNATITYRNREITRISSVFLNNAVNENFQETYRTTTKGTPHNGFSRVVFNRVPDIKISINPLTENKNKDNSHIITGKATPGSIIQFSGDPAIPKAGLIDGSTGHVKADKTGKYLYKLPNGSYLKGGNTVTAKSKLGFRTATAKTVVASNVVGTVTVKYQSVDGQQLVNPKIIVGIVGDSYKTTPKEINGWKLVKIPVNVTGLFRKGGMTVTYIYEAKPVPPVSPLNPRIEVIPENKPKLPEKQGVLSLDFVSQFNFGKQNISVQDHTYYARPQRLLNEDGTINGELPNYVQISDRRPKNKRHGWQLSVTQNGQFTNQNGQKLSGARLRFTNQQLATAQGGIIPKIKQTNPLQLVPGAKRILLIAQGNEGTGTWIYRFGNSRTAGKSVELDVPKGSNPEATSYSTTLIWELSAVPGN